MRVTTKVDGFGFVPVVYASRKRQQLADERSDGPPLVTSGDHA
jgi:hypothetical protein